MPTLILPNDPIFHYFSIASGIFWSLTYIVIIRRGFKDNTYGMPIAAVSANVCWEFIFSFVYPTPPPQLYVNIAWLVLDLVIVYQIVTYGRAGAAGATNLLTRKYFLPEFFFGLVLAFGLIYTSATEFELIIKASYPHYRSVGMVYSAFGQNLLMSILFVRMLITRDNISGQSIYIALLKLIGTVCASIALNRIFPDSSYLRFLYVAIFVIDLVYVVLLLQIFRVAGVNPWRRL